jgi:hypothetical protein
MADTTTAKKTTGTGARKSSAKKTSAKKSSAKKTSSATKTPAKKSSTAKKAPARKRSAAKASAESPPARSSAARKSGTRKAPDSDRQDRNDRRRDDAPTGGTRMAGAARDIVLGLTGKAPESVTALERSEDGWRVGVEVLELERIPSTTDVMATYEVSLDEQGELQGYRRVHRYLRGSPGDE